MRKLSGPRFKAAKALVRSANIQTYLLSKKGRGADPRLLSYFGLVREKEVSYSFKHGSAIIDT